MNSRRGSLQSPQSQSMPMHLTAASPSTPVTPTHAAAAAAASPSSFTSPIPASSASPFPSSSSRPSLLSRLQNSAWQRPPPHQPVPSPSSLDSIFPFQVSCCELSGSVCAPLLTHYRDTGIILYRMQQHCRKIGPNIIQKQVSCLSSSRSCQRSILDASDSVTVIDSLVGDGLVRKSMARVTQRSERLAEEWKEEMRRMKEDEEEDAAWNKKLKEWKEEEAAWLKKQQRRRQQQQRDASSSRRSSLVPDGRHSRIHSRHHSTSSTTSMPLPAPVILLTDHDADHGIPSPLHSSEDPSISISDSSNSIPASRRSLSMLGSLLTPRSASRRDNMTASSPSSRQHTASAIALQGALHRNPPHHFHHREPSDSPYPMPLLDPHDGLHEHDTPSPSHEHNDLDTSISAFVP